MYIQSLLYYISSPALLVANQTCTETQKCLKYYDQHCQRNFHLHCTSLIIVRIFKQSPVLPTPNKVESFLQSVFDVNKI